MHAVATGAVSYHRRAALRCQSVITIQISRNAITGHAKLLRQPHSLMAARAGCASQILLGDRRIGIDMCLDRMDAVAIRANRCQSVTATDALPVNALHEGISNRGMALAAGLRNIEFVD